MKSIKQTVASFVFVVLLSGCASIDHYRGPYPNQDISSPTPEGLTRVVFFNSDDHGWFSGQVQIEINGHAGPLINKFRYFQTFLPPGTHSLKTEHIDSLAWTDTHEITVGRTDLFVKISRRLTGQDVLVVNDLPLDFEVKYRAVRPAAYP
jgi:major membrane immunogen (membrane-anchored lipoprotein)